VVTAGWCSILWDQLSISLVARYSEIRTLDSLSQNYKEFMNNGGNLKKAIFHNNVIGKRFFNISLTQVCPPG
uniref:Uncharacterized protein n=1 Tax=Amphimedon queenslandica TaxID=400682 RepID=A0A1X7SRZ5_AMPQE